MICRKGRYKIIGGMAVGNGRYTMLHAICYCGCNSVISYNKKGNGFESKEELLKYLKETVCVRVEEFN